MTKNNGETATLRHILNRLLFRSSIFLALLFLIIGGLLITLNHKGTELIRYYYPFNKAIYQLHNRFNDSTILFDAWVNTKNPLLEKELIHQLNTALPNDIAHIRLLTTNSKESKKIEEISHEFDILRRIEWRTIDSLSTQQTDPLLERYNREILPLFHKLKINLQPSTTKQKMHSNNFQRYQALTNAQQALQKYLQTGIKHFAQQFEETRLFFMSQPKHTNTDRQSKATQYLLRRYLNTAAKLIQERHQSLANKRTTLAQRTFYPIREQLHYSLEQLASISETKIQTRGELLNALGLITLIALTLTLLTYIYLAFRVLSRLLKNIIQPVESLSHSMQSISRGEENCPIIDTNIRELSQLSTSFEHMEYEKEVRDKKLRANEKYLQHIAYYDTLTELPNKTKFTQLLNEKIHQHKKKNSTDKIVILELHIQNIESLNGIWGAKFCDKILSHFAQTLIHLEPQPALLGRISSARFAICFITQSDAQSNQVIEYAIHEINNELQQLHIRTLLQLRMGAASFPDIALTARQLINYANYASNAHSMQTTKSFVYFNKALKVELVRHSRLQKSLKNALKDQAFFLMYQPQFHSDTQKLRGFEALARWKHPLFGIVMPEEFITIAEQTDHMVTLGQQVLTMAIEQYAQWKSTYNYHALLSINASLIEILSPHYVEFIQMLCKTHSIPHHTIEIEITESIMTLHHKAYINTIQTLREKGFKIAIDDFGTGFSSLKRLKEQEIDLLKIDKFFIDDICHNTTSKNLLKSILGIAHSLDLPTLAEGVETAEQLELLKSVGCTYIQGYYLGKPLTPDQAETIIQNNI